MIGAKKASKKAFYVFLIICGCVCGVAFIQDILPSSLSPTYVFNDALKIVSQDADVQRLLGPNIKGFGEDYGNMYEGRRNQISNFIYVDEDGMKHCRIKFNVQGKLGRGVVYAEKSKEMGTGEFLYLVYQDQRTGVVIGIIDNRVYLPLEQQQELIVGKLHMLKGVLYGVRGDPETERQLALFGKLKDKVDYVDCNQNMELCSQVGLAVVPTWSIRGKMFAGFKELDDLEVMCQKIVDK